VRIAIVFDRLFPNSIGGAERWYRNLAEGLDGRYEVSYLTRRQWGDEGPRTPFETLALSPAGSYYARSGRRRIWPAIRFGVGLFWHLLRHGDHYDVVHSASFPFFSLIGAALALRLRRSRAELIVDWHEVWGREYWRSYLGALGGEIGFAIERLCTRLPRRSFTFSRLAEGRLRELRPSAPITRLTGEYLGPPEDSAAGEPTPERQAPPLLVFAGRHIPEKHVTSIPPMIAVARRRIPELRCVIFGDGPDTERLRGQVSELNLDDTVEVRGIVPSQEVATTIASAWCLVHPSEREGYGLVVLEAVSQGTPVVLVEGRENAATELIERGVNGAVAASAGPEEFARAVVDVVEAGTELRQSTLHWYQDHRDELSMESSLARVEAAYAEVEPTGGS